MVEHEAGKSYELNLPEFGRPVVSLPWSGTSLPAFYENDPRVRYCHSLVGFYDNQVMPMVAGLWKQWEAEYKDKSAEEQNAVIEQLVQSTTPSMPPRERTSMQRSLDFAIGRAPLTTTRVTVASVTPYIATGALHAAAVERLLADDFAAPGFTSACKAFGHHYLLGFLEQRGLARASVA